MLKNIGILTFHASHNYGSMLQAYALQTYLERQGCVVTIINFRGLAQKTMYGRPGKLLSKKVLKNLVTNPHLFLQNVGKWKKFEKFMNERFHLSRKLERLDEIEHVVNKELDLEGIITGGDQIWNMSCIDFSIAYYLPFKTPHTRRIAYAPSLGDENSWFPVYYDSILKALVSDFDFPSVRETNASLYLSEITGRTIPSVPDPTLLLDKIDYLLLAGEKPLIKGKYLFFYSPFSNNDVSNFVSFYAKKRGVRVVSSNKRNNRHEKDFFAYNNAGPIEFLNILVNAEMVLGDSLHLAIFSILFHKPFFIISSRPQNRIKDLLELYKLSSRYIILENGTELDDEMQIDWDFTDRNINRERQKGNYFISHSLN